MMLYVEITEDFFETIRKLECTYEQYYIGFSPDKMIVMDTESVGDCFYEEMPILEKLIFCALYDGDTNTGFYFNEEYLKEHNEKVTNCTLDIN